MAKYSNIVDIVLLLIFTGDWVSYLLSSLYKIEQTNPPCFEVSALYGFTAFSWRTLMVTLLVQKWQLKIIAPIVATFVVAGYAGYYDPSILTLLLLRAILQLVSIIVIVYCEDKVKWKLIQTSLEQEKWMQVNNFILDSIPENIMILDAVGEAHFMTEYCKAFLNHFNASSDVKEFFKKVRDLQQLQYEPDPLKASATIELNDSESNILRARTLHDLITKFPTLIRSKNLQERQFLVYNGKFQEEAHQPEKSIEVKISFVHHYKDDYIILIFRDTTQRDLLVALEQTNKYKDQLLASVSHELRAPLNGNINLIEGALNETQIPESIKETLLIPALRSSKFLLHIINDILDMSQIKEKKLGLAFRSEDLKETLKTASQLVEFQAKKKGLELLVELDSELPQNFCTDHVRVSQIILNLLTNAVKFTNQGTIKLVAKLFNDTSVKISVEDTGIGISQENLKKMFSSGILIETEDREKMNPHGVGLGLNIASNLVQLLAPQGHEKIDIVSSPERGSTFSFVLENKLHCSEERSNYNFSEVAEELTFVTRPRVFEKMKTVANNSWSSSFKIEKSDSGPLLNSCLCPKVLIVDDNPFNTMALETILRSLGIKCDSAFNGASALQKLKDFQANPCSKDCKSYSVIFMDQEMPGMSGAETVREIRTLQKEGKLPSEMRIIGCTAHKGKEEVDKFLASGLENCIFKPVTIAIIKESLKELI